MLCPQTDCCIYGWEQIYPLKSTCLQITTNIKTAFLTMYDSWLEAIDSGNIVGVALCNMSAAFNVVDTKLLLDTCSEFGFDRKATQLMWSYLTNRSQRVSISGSLSLTHKLEVGLPQGLILGPLFYSIFISAFPETVHREDCQSKLLNGEVEPPQFTPQCSSCGNITSFADDSSYSVGEKTPSKLSQKVGEKFGSISNFLTEQRLKIKESKTHLLVLATQQKRRNNDISSVSITTPNITIIGRFSVSPVILPTPVENIARIAKSCPENISSVVEVSSCFY